jgi:hypothetical protein
MLANMAKTLFDHVTVQLEAGLHLLVLDTNGRHMNVSSARATIICTTNAFASGRGLAWLPTGMCCRKGRTALELGIKPSIEHFCSFDTCGRDAQPLSLPEDPELLNWWFPLAALEQRCWRARFPLVERWIPLGTSSFRLLIDHKVKPERNRVQDFCHCSVHSNKH